MKLVVLALCVCFLATTLSAEKIKYTIALNGQQVEPPVNTRGTGRATMIFNTNKEEVNFKLLYNTQNEAITAFLSAGTDVVKTWRVDQFTAKLKGKNVKLNDEQIAALKNGQMFLTLTTIQNPDGEIRGKAVQLETSFKAEMDGEETIPPVITNAKGTGEFVFNAETAELHYRVEHTVQSPTGAHLHGPADITKNAGVLVEFPSAASPITGKVKLEGRQIEALTNQLMYLQIHSEANPNGEIRGQVEVTTAKVKVDTKDEEEDEEDSPEAAGLQGLPTESESESESGSEDEDDDDNDRDEDDDSNDSNDSKNSGSKGSNDGGLSTLQKVLIGGGVTVAVIAVIVGAVFVGMKVKAHRRKSYTYAPVDVSGPIDVGDYQPPGASGSTQA